MHFTIVGNPENRRVLSFCETVQRLGYRTPAIIPYEAWLSGKVSMEFTTGSMVKIDSPGENERVRSMLIMRGLDASGDSLSPDVERLHVMEFGAIGLMRTWYMGFCHGLEEIRKAITDHFPVRVMNDPGEIQTQFDKPRCQSLLQQQGIAVPFRLPPFTGYDDLLEKMHAHQLTKVFIKPAHASSASGIIAFRKMGQHVQAVTTTEMVPGAEGVRLYNSLRVRTYTKEKEIATLINSIWQEEIFAEEWLPKATLNDRFFDIRVLVIDGKARHTVIRTSKHIITNLHLGNQRGDLNECVDRIGVEKMMQVKQLAESAAACFPASLYMGIDILVTADLRHLFVLEVNAFGDLLPGLVHNGETCYEAQVRAMVKQQEHTKLL